ncbi:hypothetical protein [Mycolicibacterium hodleri]|uniref:hypothetical protein n=1 Tax=Mycolicibacterium hodleri TaxID=49897 RepID=UPI001F467E59|nr:hypothetical protein [Mycolicibacterium hodleri]
MHSDHATRAQPSVPGWLRFVLASDRAGSAWYLGLGFFFAPALAIASPWPALTTTLWVVIALAGLSLGLLGIAMATGLAIVLKSGVEIPEDYWRSIFDYVSSPNVSSPNVNSQTVSEPPTSPCSRPASA